MLNSQLKEAVKLLSVYTSGHFDIWALSGPSKAACRSQIMTVLTGVKTPKSRSGVTAIKSLFMAEMTPEGDCQAIRDRNFAYACNELLAN